MNGLLLDAVCPGDPIASARSRHTMVRGLQKNIRSTAIFIRHHVLVIHSRGFPGRVLQGHLSVRVPGFRRGLLSRRALQQNIHFFPVAAGDRRMGRIRSKRQLIPNLYCRAHRIRMVLHNSPRIVGNRKMVRRISGILHHGGSQSLGRRVRLAHICQRSLENRILGHRDSFAVSRHASHDPRRLIRRRILRQRDLRRYQEHCPEQHSRLHPSLHRGPRYVTGFISFRPAANLKFPAQFVFPPNFQLSAPRFSPSPHPGCLRVVRLSLERPSRANSYTKAETEHPPY